MIYLLFKTREVELILIRTNKTIFKRIGLSFLIIYFQINNAYKIYFNNNHNKF